MRTSKVSLGSAIIATGAQTAYNITNHPLENKKIFVGWGTTSSGVGAATILIQGSLEGTHWATLGTISLTLGTVETAGNLENFYPYPYVRANVTAISGTNATVAIDLGL